MEFAVATDTEPPYNPIKQRKTRPRGVAEVLLRNIIDSPDILLSYEKTPHAELFRL
jgi:hypothetical protein